MGTIIPFLQHRVASNVFEPQDVAAMSRALDDVCEMLKLGPDSDARAIMASRIIELARGGERSPTRLRDRVLYEAGMAEYAGLGAKPRNDG